MSRLARSTVKFAGSTFARGSSPVCTLIAPKVTLPAFPFTRLPTRNGITRDRSRPMRRVKKRYGVSPAPAPTPELARPANANVPRPSRKKSRFSGKNRSKRVRLTCCSSTSTCEKSVLTVRSAVRLCVMPNFRSPPMRRVGSLDSTGVTVRSVDTPASPYGFSSTLRPPEGTCRPSRVPADETLRMPRKVVSARGTGARCDHSFFHRTTRRRLIPHVWSPPGG